MSCFKIVVSDKIEFLIRSRSLDGFEGESKWNLYY